MTQDRETITITIPISKQEVVLKAWITGRESQMIDNAMFSGIETVGAGKSLAPKLSASMIADQENAAIKAVVISVGGKDNDVLNTVLNLRKPDYSAIVKAVSKIVEEEFDEKKEPSSEINTTESSNEEQAL